LGCQRSSSPRISGYTTSAEAVKCSRSRHCRYGEEPRTAHPSSERRSCKRGGHRHERTSPPHIRTAPAVRMWGGDDVTRFGQQRPGPDRSPALQRKASQPTPTAKSHRQRPARRPSSSPGTPPPLRGAPARHGKPNTTAAVGAQATGSPAERHRATGNPARTIPIGLDLFHDWYRP
jgi:hypothetical protein